MESSLSAAKSAADKPNSCATVAFCTLQATAVFIGTVMLILAMIYGSNEDDDAERFFVYVVIYGTVEIMFYVGFVYLYFPVLRWRNIRIVLRASDMRTKVTLCITLPIYAVALAADFAILDSSIPVIIVASFASMLANFLVFVSLVALDLYDASPHGTTPRIRTWLTERGWRLNVALLALTMTSSFMLFVLKESAGGNRSQWSILHQVIETVMLVSGIKVFLFAVEKAFAKLRRPSLACLCSSAPVLTECYHELPQKEDILLQPFLQSAGTSQSLTADEGMV
jgi:hypothetical protein